MVKKKIADDTSIWLDEYYTCSARNGATIRSRRRGLLIPVWILVY